jgi:hypothetical protein
LGNLLRIVDFDPLDPSTYDRVAPRTLIANYLFAAMAKLLVATGLVLLVVVGYGNYLKAAQTTISPSK